MNIFRILIVLSSVFIFNSSFATGGGFVLKKENQKIKDTSTYVSPVHDDNERCLKCHGQAKYEYANEKLGTQIKALMCSERIIDRKEFYRSNHKSFSCTDCHSEQYTTFPHSGELRMEPKLNCLDCHGGDEKFAKYHFEEIEAEYKQSTHFKLEQEGFSCWKCHDPHTYRINATDRKDIKEIVAYDNAICLSCHSDFNRFQLLSDREEINLIKKHDWLPNQSAHLANIRCIECHTKISNDVPVAHQILPKAEAVRRCNECHARNSILMASLYKFESKVRRRDGFLNGVILNESYVIGANRNEYLNILSLIIFASVLLVIAVHITFRLKRNNSKTKEA
jgi:predicted CXXCH cytochrome family protein